MMFFFFFFSAPVAGFVFSSLLLGIVQRLHPCIETLNSRNLGFEKDSFKDSFGQGPYVKDSFEVSFGFRTLWRPRLIKDLKNVQKALDSRTPCIENFINHWFYKQRGRKTKKTIGFTVKPVPATSRQQRATDSDPEFHILALDIISNPYKQAGKGNV